MTIQLVSMTPDQLQALVQQQYGPNFSIAGREGEIAGFLRSQGAFYSDINRFLDAYKQGSIQPTGTLSAYTGLPEFTPTTSATGYQAPTIPMGGATEDQINYLSALRRLSTQDQMARLQSQQQRSEIATAYEPQIRKAGREMYNQQVKAQASLGARGISGAPGLSVAARRAAMAAPAMQRTSLISDRNRQLAALERTLTSQLSSYEEEIRRNQEQLTRATTLANQLTGTGK